MFGLFKADRSFGLEQGASLQRRVLCFASDVTGIDNRALDRLSDVMEIKVFRSKGRKRVKPDFQSIQSVGMSPRIDRKKPQLQAAGGIK